MARGFGARETTGFGTAGTSAQETASSVIKDREVANQLAEKLASFKSDKDLDKKAMAASSARIQFTLNFERQNKARVTEEVKKEMGDEFGKWHGDEYEIVREEDKIYSERLPTKGESEVERRIRDELNKSKEYQDLVKEESELSKKRDERDKMMKEVETPLYEARKREAVGMEKLMNSLVKNDKGGDKGEIGDGKPGNGVRSSDGKVELRLEDFAYLLNSVNRDDYESGGAPQDDEENIGLSFPTFRAGQNEDIEMPFSFYVETEDTTDQKVVGYDSERFNIERDYTRRDRSIVSAELNAEEFRDGLEKSGFKFKNDDFESFRRAFERVSLKRAPELESEDLDNY